MFSEEGLDGSGRAVLGQVAQVYCGEVAGKADLGNSSAIFEYDKCAGDSTTKILGLLLMLLYLILFNTPNIRILLYFVWAFVNSRPEESDDSEEWNYCHV